MVASILKRQLRGRDEGGQQQIALLSNRNRVGNGDAAGDAVETEPRSGAKAFIRAHLDAAGIGHDRDQAGCIGRILIIGVADIVEEHRRARFRRASNS